MGKPLISCIVPVFNGERYLAETLDSISAQTYRPLEIIVVDDGSTDGTAAVAARYGDQIRYIRQDNAGAPGARNRGLSIAQGAFLAFLDSDDLWHPEKLTRQMKCFQDRPELDLCVTHIQNFWIRELEEEAKRFQNHRLRQTVPGYVTQTLLARRDLFDRIGAFDMRLQHGDAQDWFLRAAEKDTVIELLPDVLVYRRLHRSNYSRQISAALYDYLRIVKASLDRRRQGKGSLNRYEFPGSHPKD
jgi:glycosyltransferase involved in cell wall biosynthesis